MDRIGFTDDDWGFGCRVVKDWSALTGAAAVTYYSCPSVEQLASEWFAVRLWQVYTDVLTKSQREDSATYCMPNSSLLSTISTSSLIEGRNTSKFICLLGIISRLCTHCPLHVTIFFPFLFADWIAINSKSLWQTSIAVLLTRHIRQILHTPEPMGIR